MMVADLELKRSLFERAVATARGTRARLKALTAAFFALSREKRELIQLVRRNTNALEESARSRVVRAYQAALPAVIERVVADGVRARELRPGDARLLSWHFVAMVEVALTRYAAGLWPDGDRRIDHVLDMFFRGVQA
jgi:hypothetical protein